LIVNNNEDSPNKKFVAVVGNSHCESSDSDSIRHRAFKLLDKNPLLTGKTLTKIMDLDYHKHGHYLNNLKAQWKYHYKNERGSKCSFPCDVHCWRGFCYLPGGLVDRKAALAKGWIESRSRNRFLLWKGYLGRLQWFLTNRVNLYVRKPAHLGKAKQLFCEGFFATGLIGDVKVLEAILDAIKFKSGHFVFETNEKLPKMDIGLFNESNGVLIKTGDRSHPNSVEVIATYMDWAERTERVLESITEGFRMMFSQAGNKVGDKETPKYVS